MANAAAAYQTGRSTTNRYACRLRIRIIRRNPPNMDIANGY